MHDSPSPSSLLAPPPPPPPRRGGGGGLALRQAEAAARFARLAGDNASAAALDAWREMSREVVLGLHWNANVSAFAVVPLATDVAAAAAAVEAASAAAAAPYAGYEVRRSDSECNLTAVRTPDQPVDVRELLGFVPWYVRSFVFPSGLCVRFSPGDSSLSDAASAVSSPGAR